MTPPARRIADRPAVPHGADSPSVLRVVAACVVARAAAGDLSETLRRGNARIFSGLAIQWRMPRAPYEAVFPCGRLGVSDEGVDSVTATPAETATVLHCSTTARDASASPNPPTWVRAWIRSAHESPAHVRDLKGVLRDIEFHAMPGDPGTSKALERGYFFELPRPRLR